MHVQLFCQCCCFLFLCLPSFVVLLIRATGTNKNTVEPSEDSPSLRIFFSESNVLWTTCQRWNFRPMHANLAQPRCSSLQLLSLSRYCFPSEIYSYSSKELLVWQCRRQVNRIFCFQLWMKGVGHPRALVPNRAPRGRCSSILVTLNTGSVLRACISIASFWQILTLSCTN